MIEVWLDFFFPPFSVREVFLDPWMEDHVSYGWIVLMGLCASTGCGWVGTFLLLRRQALLGDALSHSLLPGIVIAVIVTGVFLGPVTLAGAFFSGLAATFCIEWLQRRMRLKPDAAMAVVFPTFFAVGVVLVNVYAGTAHLDQEHILYGDIEFVFLEDPVVLAGIEFGPGPVVQMAVVALLVGCLCWMFYKELVVTSFDPVLGRLMGFSSTWFHYGLMVVLVSVLVSAFYAVGAILVIAMLIFPGATALLLWSRLPSVLLAVPVISALSSLGGLHLAIWLDCSVAGAMVVVAGILFGAGWFFAPGNGLFVKWWNTRFRREKA